MVGITYSEELGRSMKNRTGSDKEADKGDNIQEVANFF
jgi:hypothetical protein